MNDHSWWHWVLSQIISHARVVKEYQKKWWNLCLVFTQELSLQYQSELEMWILILITLWAHNTVGKRWKSTKLKDFRKWKNKKVKVGYQSKTKVKVKIWKNISHKKMTILTIYNVPEHHIFNKVRTIWYPFIRDPLPLKNRGKWPAISWKRTIIQNCHVDFAIHA